MKTLIVIAMLLLASSACTKSTSSRGVYENSTYDPGIYVDLDEWPKFQKTMPTETELNKMLSDPKCLAEIKAWDDERGDKAENIEFEKLTKCERAVLWYSLRYDKPFKRP